MKVMVKEVGKPLAVVDTKEKYFGDFARSCLGKDITVERVYLDGMEYKYLLPHSFKLWGKFKE